MLTLAAESRHCQPLSFPHHWICAYSVPSSCTCPGLLLECSMFIRAYCGGLEMSWILWEENFSQKSKWLGGSIVVSWRYLCERTVVWGFSTECGPAGGSGGDILEWGLCKAQVRISWTHHRRILNRVRELLAYSMESRSLTPCCSERLWVTWMYMKCLFWNVRLKKLIGLK
jgi:hypothetical protein